MGYHVFVLIPTIKYYCTLMITQARVMQANHLKHNKVANHQNLYDV